MLKHLPLKRLAETLAARDEGHERRAPVKGISERTRAGKGAPRRRHVTTLNHRRWRYPIPAASRRQLQTPRGCSTLCRSWHLPWFLLIGPLRGAGGRGAEGPRNAQSWKPLWNHSSRRIPAEEDRALAGKRKAAPDPADSMFGRTWLLNGFGCPHRPRTRTPPVDA